jgi:hypothetical protein
MAARTPAGGDTVSDLLKKLNGPIARELRKILTEELADMEDTAGGDQS